MKIGALSGFVTRPTAWLSPVISGYLVIRTAFEGSA